MNVKISDTAQEIISEHDIIKEDIRSLKTEIDLIHHELHNTQEDIKDLDCKLMQLNQNIKRQQRIYDTWFAVLTGVVIGLLIAVIS